MAKNKGWSSTVEPDARTQLHISVDLRRRYQRLGKGIAKGFRTRKHWHPDFVEKILERYAPLADEVARELGWAGAKVLDETLTDLDTVNKHLTLHWQPGHPGISWERTVADEAFNRLDIDGLRQKWETIPD